MYRPGFAAEAKRLAHDTGLPLTGPKSKFQGCIDDLLDAGAQVACQSTVQALGLATVLDGAYASYDFGKSWTKIMNYTQLKLAGTSRSRFVFSITV